MFLHEHHGTRHRLAGAKAEEVWHLACICTSTLARGLAGAAAVELLHLVCICTKILARGTSCGREGRGVVAFGMYLHEYLGARRLLVRTNAVELLHLVCICASILARGAFLRASKPWSCAM
jgi:hypothetical protein